MIRTFFPQAKRLAQWAEWGHASLVRLWLDHPRQTVAESGVMTPEEIDFALLFRQTLVVGGLEKML